MKRVGAMRGEALGTLACASALLLGGCLDTTVEMSAKRSLAEAAQPPLVARAGVSPHGASLGFADLDGPPEALRARFMQQFAAAAEAKDVALTKPESALYKLRGYLTASPAQGGTRLAYVLDVYDKKGRRAQRLTFEAGLKSGADPWAVVDEGSLAAFAQRGAADVAAFLSNTPEAVAAAEKDSGVSVVAGRAPARDETPRPDGVAQLR